MSKEVIAALGRRDADFLEKFVLKVLKLGADHWGRLCNEAHLKAPGATSNEEYNQAFDEWHRLRLTNIYLNEEIQRGYDRMGEMTWEPTEDTATSTSPTSEEG